MNDVIITPFPRPSERGGMQADQVPGLGVGPSDLVRLHSSDCRFWGAFGFTAIALGFPAVEISIFATMAFWALAAWLLYEANKRWELTLSAMKSDYYWLGYHHGWNCKTESNCPSC